MAVTEGSTRPFVAVGGQGSAHTPDRTLIELKAGAAIKNGDIVIVDDGASSRGLQANNSSASYSAESEVLGVAEVAQGYSTIKGNNPINPEGTNVPLNYSEGNLVDFVSVVLAWPHQKFAGNLIGPSSVDVTGDWQLHPRDWRGYSTAGGGDTDNFGCVMVKTDAYNSVFVHEWEMPQHGLEVATGNRVTRFGHHAGHGLLNPRVIFSFKSAYTVFGRPIDVTP